MKISTRVLAMVAALALAAAFLQMATPARAGAEKPTDVSVINTPLPVSQGSAWTTAISGTPAVTVSTVPGGSVEVANDKGNPLPVRVVNHDDLGGMNFAAVAQFNHLDTAVVVTLGTAPSSGFVAEFVSALAQMPNGQRVHIRLFSSVQHFFAPEFVGTDFTNDVLVLSQPTRFYADTEIKANVTRFADNSGTGSVQIALSGHVIQ